jgi:hypothetical protein
MEDQKAPAIIEMLDVHLGSMTRSKALKENKCQGCGKDALEFKNEVSRKEYLLTAWCQACQDAFWYGDE